MTNSNILKRQTGFDINYEKTKLYRIGSLKNSNATLITSRVVSWTSREINVLGVWIDHNEENIQKLNYENLISKAKTILNTWYHRNLSLIGKIKVINTLVASLFNYKMMVLPNMDPKYVKQIEEIFVQFIWNKRKPKIPTRALMSDYSNGGIRLVDVAKREQALKATWIQIIANDDQIANLAFSMLNSDLKDWIFECNLHITDVGVLQISNSFWKNVLEAWCLYHYQDCTSTEQDIHMVQL